MEIKIQVEKDKITSISQTPLAAGNLNSYTCLFSFDSAWDNLIKFAVFIRNEVYYNVSLPSDTCSIPFEVLEKPGNVYIGVFGFDKAENSSVRISVTPKIMTVLKGSFSAESVAADEEELTIWEQYVAASQNARDKAYEYAQSAAVSETNAQTAAEDARNAAEDAKISLSEETAARTAKDTELEENITSLTQKSTELEERITSSETILEGKADKTYVDDSDSETLESAKAYTEDLVNQAQSEISDRISADEQELWGKADIAYVDEADSDTLAASATYTDNKYTELFNALSNDIIIATDIAKGRATGYVFDTVDDMNTWLADTDNKAKLVLGDNLYIRATDVPDYWWDGSTAQQLETQKVDLSEYATKAEVEDAEARATDYTNVSVGPCALKADVSEALSKETTARTAKDTELEGNITVINNQISELTEIAYESTSDVNALAHNTQYRITIPLQDYGVYQLYFVLPIINMPSVFECSAYIAPVPLAPVILTKDTEVSSADYPISWFGDDCDENGVFTPQANTHYEISFKRVGTDSDNKPIIIARVGAWQ